MILKKLKTDTYRHKYTLFSFILLESSNKKIIKIYINRKLIDI